MQLRRGDVLKGRYRIEEVIGQGAMGAVYLSRDLTLQGAFWALKTLSEDEVPPAEVAEAVTLFAREADMLSRLHHAGLPQVIDHFSEPGRHVLVMQRIFGETLEDRMARQGRPYREAELIPLLMQLCACLHYLHTQQPHPIVFRDLKPSNCMVTVEGKVQLIDFGIARYYKPGRPNDTVSLGTPGFCAPEQYGGAQTEPRSDIYSVGAMAWHLLSGKDAAEVGFIFPPLRSVAPQCSKVMEDIIARCLALDVESRYPSTAELRADLEYALSCLACSAKPWPTPKVGLVPAASVTNRLHHAGHVHLASAAATSALAGSQAAPFTAVRPPAVGGAVERRLDRRFLASWAERSFRIWLGPGSVHFPRVVALMLVMLFLLPFSTIVAPLSPSESHEDVVCRHSLQAVRDSVDQYYNKHARYPARLSDLPNWKYLGQLSDHSEAFVYEPTATNYRLYCEKHKYR